jgi:hypothetical protein
MADEVSVIDEEKIHKALDQLMSACVFSGESGTEDLFEVLSEAIRSVQNKWDSVVGQSKRDGRGYDVNALLAEEIAKGCKSGFFYSRASTNEEISEILRDSGLEYIPVTRKK